MKGIFLSVVIPCYNEAKNIRLGALENVAYFLKKKKFNWEALLVNDGSKDESLKLMHAFIREHARFRIIDRPHQGKAAAVLAGAQAAKGDIILFSDLDQATPIGEINKLIRFFPDYDVVIGSRNTRRRGAPFLRLAMARGFMILRNTILNLGIKDTQCGFKAFKKEVARTVFPRLMVYAEKKNIAGSAVSAGFDVEFLYVAKISGFRIKEVPVEWHYQETRRVNPVKDSINGLMDLIKIRWNKTRGVYRTGK